MTVTLPDTRPATPGTDAEPDHLYCCDPDVAMCGADLTDVEEIPDGDDDNLCRYCRYVNDNDYPCPVDGCSGDAA